MASAPFSTAARAHSQFPAGASSSGRTHVPGLTGASRGARSVIGRRAEDSPPRHRRKVAPAAARQRRIGRCPSTAYPESLKTKGRNDESCLWLTLVAASAGATLESSPGCNPGKKFNQRSEPRQGWPEKAAAVAYRSNVLSTPAGVLAITPANPGLHPGLLSSVAPAGAAKRGPEAYHTHPSYISFLPLVPSEAEHVLRCGRCGLRVVGCKEGSGLTSQPRNPQTATATPRYLFAAA